MGSALALAILNRNYDLTVWNRTLSKAQPIVTEGAVIADSVLSVANSCDILVVSLLDHSATDTAIISEEVGESLRGKSLIQLSTTTAKDVVETMDWTTRHDINFLKGGVLVYPNDILSGSGCIVYGGKRQLFDDLRPLLDAMGGQPMFVSENPVDTIGATSAVYAFIYSSLMSFTLGVAVCHRTGIPAEAFTHNVMEPFIKSGVLMNFLGRIGSAVHERKYDNDVQATLDVWIDALKQTISEIDEIGIETTSLRPLMDQLQRAANKGHNNDDIGSVFEVLIEKPAAV
jgi:3-hydroxyisobutyrate dehydrogenase-like beta-hydroxyacid dehydrogenase